MKEKRLSSRKPRPEPAKLTKFACKLNRIPCSELGTTKVGAGISSPVLMPTYRQYIAAAGVVAIVIYLSFYPFQWRIHLPTAGPLIVFTSPWRSWPESRGDFIANTVFYLPCGYFVTGCLSSRLPMLLRLLATVLLCMALSTTLELSQYYIAHRDADIRDTYANSLGALLGSGAALIFGVRWRTPLLASMKRDPFPTLLLAAFVGARLYPYVPIIDLHKYLHAIRPLLAFVAPTGNEIFLRTACWMAVYFIVEYMFGRRRVVPLFIGVAMLVFLGDIVIDNTEVRISELLGAIFAFPLSFLLMRATMRPAIFLAVIFTVAIVIERLQPFDFDPVSHGFGWIPFAALVHGSNEHSLITISEKSFLYGTLIWLWVQAGASQLAATFAVALLLLLCSFAGMHIPGRISETTDAVLALLSGGFMMHLSSTSSEYVAVRRRSPGQPPHFKLR